MQEQICNRVCLGSRVLLQFEDGDRVEFTIKARDGDFAAGVVSATSPLAQNILGAQEGDQISYVVHQVRQTVKVLRVVPAEARRASHRHAVPA
jgi:transcription elongation GreA/GreB family factor